MKGEYMKTINDIIKMIDLQEEVKPLVLSAYDKLNIDDYREYIKGLLDSKTSLEARERLKDALHPDEGNMKILAIMLYALTFTYQKYMEKGISEEIFVATIKCYKRFLNEHKVGYNRWFFDRDWWTYKQIAMVIFRIGELEYEMKDLDGEKFISMHIPSDSNIELELVNKSIKEAKKFFKINYPEYSDVEYRCNTWLLSPALKELLPATSKIIQFQS